MNRQKIARFLYSIFRREMEALLIEDLLLQIPTEVNKPFIELMGARKEMMRKWVFFEANSILTRPPTTQNNPDRRTGMLIILQALLLAITSSESSHEELPNGVTIPSRAKPDESWKNGMSEFRKGAKVLNKPKEVEA